MSTFLALLYIAIGLTVAETYAHIRKQAVQQAYKQGYDQATREKELWEAGVNKYAITIPRTTEHHLPYPRPLGVPASAPVADDSFMQHLTQNGQATVKFHKGTCN